MLSALDSLPAHIKMVDTVAVIGSSDVRYCLKFSVVCDNANTGLEVLLKVRNLELLTFTSRTTGNWF